MEAVAARELSSSADAMRPLRAVTKTAAAQLKTKATATT